MYWLQITIDCHYLTVSVVENSGVTSWVLLTHVLSWGFWLGSHHLKSWLGLVDVLCTWFTHWPVLATGSITYLPWLPSNHYLLPGPFHNLPECPYNKAAALLQASDVHYRPALFSVRGAQSQEARITRGCLDDWFPHFPLRCQNTV